MLCHSHPIQTLSYQLQLVTPHAILFTRDTPSFTPIYFTPNISASHHILCHSHPIHTLSHQQQFTHNVSVCVYRLLSIFTRKHTSICKFHTKTHTIHTEKFICTQQGVHGGTSTQLTFFHTKMGGLRCLWTSHPLQWTQICNRLCTLIGYKPYSTLVGKHTVFFLGSFQNNTHSNQKWV
jgi:hypothetical protein